MNIRTFENTLRISTPAKLNLFLEIKNLRDDGYHELETVMCKISIFDHMLFQSTNDGTLQLDVSVNNRISHQSIPTDEKNLIIKAFRVMRDLADHSCGATIKLFKNIPVQAGLGGASGNAAGAIVAANRIWNLGWPKSKLIEVANTLGSDVAFFLNSAVAKCTGRGEQVQNLNYPCCLNVVVAKPPGGMSTEGIYSRCVVPAKPITSEGVISGLRDGRTSELGKKLFNRLEPFAANENTDIERMQREFERTNCAGHQLTGSGSCYFGIYPNVRSMAVASKKIANCLPDMKIFTGHTLNSPNHCLGS